MTGELVIISVFISAFLLGFAAARTHLKKRIQDLRDANTDKDIAIHDLTMDLDFANSRVTSLEADLEGCITKKELESIEVQYQNNLQQKDTWLAEQKTQIKTLHKQMEEGENERKSLLAQCQSQEEEIINIQDQLKIVQHRLSVADEQLFGSNKEEFELPNLQEVIFEREQEIAELRGKIEELEEIIADENIMEDYGFKNMEIFQRLENQLGQINEEASSDVEEDEVKNTNTLADKAANDPNFPKEKLDIDVVHASFATEIDDLTQIKGIGDYTALKLNAIGIQNFKQISQLSDEDIKKVNTAIKFFPGRIKRDGWVEQATQLLNKKEN